MKKIAVTAAAVLASLAMAAPAQAVAPDHNRRDLANYLSFLKVNMPGAATMGRTMMHTRGDIICRSIGRGVALESVMALGQASGMSDDAIVMMTVGAVKFLCPSEQHVIDEFLDS